VAHWRGGLVKASDGMVKVLANGDITTAIILAVDKVSSGARAKIEAAGGSVKE
jgi:large subunit ribosomal protein L15